MTQKIKCPQCQCEISVDEVLSHQVEDKIRAQFEAKQKEQAAQLALKEQSLTAKLQAFEASKQNLAKTVEDQVAAKVKVQQSELEVKIKAQVASESAEQIKTFQQIIEAKNKKLTELSQDQLKLLEEKEKFENEKRGFQLEMKRQQDEITEKLRLQISKETNDKYTLELAEMKKQLDDARKMNAELDQKLKQGSQQTQGEVLELELEELLKREFATDDIVPVGKGVNGADITQVIMDKYGQVCGSIVWETKRTKTWTEGWVQKLKDDQRNKKAEIAVIVSTVLPKQIKTFGLHDGIWVTDFQSALGLALALRKGLLNVASVKQAAIGKNEKMEVLYNYLSGIEFKQRIESIVESFTAMKSDLDQEKRAVTKLWEKRERQINRVVDNTVKMYGDLDGLMGKALPRIELLELPGGTEELA